MSLQLPRPFIVGITAWLATSAQAAFVAQPDGSLIEGFNDGVLDTVTWTTSTMSQPVAASESGGELKLVQTLGFNGAYSTLANGVNESTGLSDGSGLVEPKTAGNNNHRVRAVMRRRDPFDSLVAMGLSITTNLYLRTCADVGDYACIIWTSDLHNSGSNSIPNSDIPVGQIEEHSSFFWQIGNAAPPEGIGACNPGPPEEGCLPRKENYPNPTWDWTGKTRYAFEVNWLTKTSAEFLVQEILRPDQNNDMDTDIVDFGQFAGDFGKSGPGGDLNWDGTFSDFDDSGTVDIADFGQLAGAFGKDPIELFARRPSDAVAVVPDWSTDPICGDGSCHPDSFGVQIYAHNVGTLWVDYVQILGDDSSAPDHSPEPASIALIGISMMALLRRRRAG